MRFFQLSVKMRELCSVLNMEMAMEMNPFKFLVVFGYLSVAIEDDVLNVLWQVAKAENTAGGPVLARTPSK